MLFSLVVEYIRSFFYDDQVEEEEKKYFKSIKVDAIFLYARDDDGKNKQFA